MFNSGFLFFTRFSTSNSSYVLPPSFTIVDNPKPPTFREGTKGCFLTLAGCAACSNYSAFYSFLFPFTRFSTSNSSWVLPPSLTRVDIPSPPTFNDGISGFFCWIGYDSDG